jgi:hypothetical protein
VESCRDAQQRIERSRPASKTVSAALDDPFGFWGRPHGAEGNSCRGRRTFLLDPKKHVKIEASVTPKQAEIVIEDEGPGFDRKAVPDPTLDENIEKCSGRGILLMESYMNCVEWTKGGRRVRLVKKKESK